MDCAAIDDLVRNFDLHRIDDAITPAELPPDGTATNLVEQIRLLLIKRSIEITYDDTITNRWEWACGFDDETGKRVLRRRPVTNEEPRRLGAQIKPFLRCAPSPAALLNALHGLVDHIVTSAAGYGCRFVSNLECMLSTDTISVSFFVY